LHSARVHGKLIFLDLRDRYGITQCVAQPKTKAQLEFYKRLRKESVLIIKGRVQERLPGQKNPNMATGDIEVKISNIEVVSEAAPTPFKVEDEVMATEDLRLKYRYLDIRRRPVQQALILRHRVTKVIRDYMDALGFVEVETPVLAKSTPEGARDYLVPSRVHRGKFYALPQSPQIYKQLLMIGGLDRYFQIVKCMRDEDLRADRQPEFTQFDMEMSFVEEDDIFEVVEGMMKAIWKRVLGKPLKTPFKRLSYEEAMERYGTDKPDLRFGFELQDITSIAKSSGFKILEGVAKQGGCVKAINANGALKLINKGATKKLEVVAKEFKAKGLLQLGYDGKALTGAIVKHLNTGFLTQLKKRLKPKRGDAIFIIGDKERDIVNRALGGVRTLLGELCFPNKRGFEFLWVTGFPLMEYNEEEQRWVSAHHPFTSPVEEDIPLLEKAINKVRSRSYDLVLNGTELGSGSIRISRAEVQKRVFKALGISDKEAEQKFGFFIEALRYGTPPHGGIALGFDRFVAIITNSQSLRDVIAFPKNKYAQSLMEGSPSEVSKKQLDELGISIRK